jgi:hypothetical protein
MHKIKNKDQYFLFHKVSLLVKQVGYKSLIYGSSKLAIIFSSHQITRGGDVELSNRDFFNHILGYKDKFLQIDHIIECKNNTRLLFVDYSPPLK